MEKAFGVKPTDRKPVPGPKIQPRSCENCRHLEYIEDESYEIQDGGYLCNKRIYLSGPAEDRHYRQLDDPGYRARGKKCFEARE